MIGLVTSEPLMPKKMHVPEFMAYRCNQGRWASAPRNRDAENKMAAMFCSEVEASRATVLRVIRGHEAQQRIFLVVEEVNDDSSWINAHMSTELCHYLYALLLRTRPGIGKNRSVGSSVGARSG